jgi:hypothetical protein
MSVQNSPPAVVPVMVSYWPSYDETGFAPGQAVPWPAIVTLQAIAPSGKMRPTLAVFRPGIAAFLVRSFVLAYDDWVAAGSPSDKAYWQ